MTAPKTSKKSAKIRKGPAAILLVVVILVIAVVFTLIFNRPDSRLKSGLTYLENQEAVQTADLETELASKQRERMLEAVNSGEYSIFSLYKNSLIFGDSRVYGFGSYDFVPTFQVLADAGATIENISDYLDVVKNVQPQKIYFSYGVNDMGLEIGQDLGENGYAQVYEEQINKVLEASPNSQIIINSIIPVTPARLEQTPRWGKVDDYNRQIRELCERRGWTYIDNTEISQYGNADIYNPDGVHFLPVFYPVWARNMIFPGS